MERCLEAMITDLSIVHNKFGLFLFLNLQFVLYYKFGVGLMYFFVKESSVNIKPRL